MTILKLSTLIVFVLGVSACASQSPIANGDSPQDSSAYQESFQSVCEEMSREFGNPKGSYVREKFNVDHYLDQALLGLKRSKSPYYQSYLKKVMATKQQYAVMDRAYSSMSRPWQIQDMTLSGAKASCLLFSEFSENGVAIVELELVSHRGEIELVNWYDHVTESNASEQLRQLSIDVKQLAESGQQNSKAMTDLMAFMASLIQSTPYLVGNAYNALDPAFKAQPSYALSYVAAAAKVGGQVYQTALENLDTRFAQDGEYGLLMLDYRFERGEYDKALAAVDRAEQSVGRNEGLDAIRMMLYEQQGKTREYYRAAANGLDINLGAEVIYWSLLDNFIREGAYADAVLVIDAIAHFLGYEFTQESMASVPEYQAFAQSQDFAMWVSEQE